MHEKLVHFRFEIFLISQLAILFGGLIIPYDLFDAIFSPIFFYLNLLAGGIILISKKNLNFFRYPDGKSKELRNEISKKFDCDREKIICGAGSDEVIQMICQLYLNPKDEVIVPQYSFLMYRIYAKIVGATVLFAKEKNIKLWNKTRQRKRKSIRNSK